MFFPESDHGVGTKQKEDDEEIQPVLDQRGQNHGGFNHPRNGTPEVGEELQEFIRLLFGDLVGSILRLTLLGLGLSESVCR